MTNTVFVVSGEGFGDNEDAWEVCGVYTSRIAAEMAIAEWNDVEDEEYGFRLNYKIEDFPLEGQ